MPQKTTGLKGKPPRMFTSKCCAQCSLIGQFGTLNFNDIFFLKLRKTFPPIQSQIIKSLEWEGGREIESVIFKTEAGGRRVLAWALK